MKHRLSLSEQGYRKALITGSSSGLGAAMAHALAAEGLRVIGLSRHAPVHPAPSYQHHCVDLLDAEQLDAVCRLVRDDPPDIWINNAGQGLIGSAWDASDAAIDRTHRLLYEVPVRLSRFFEQSCRQLEGRPAYLIQVSSLAVELPIPAMPYYNAAKAALSGFTQSLLLDDELPFRLIDFRPGDFNTAFMENMQSGAHTEPALLKHLHMRHRRAPSAQGAATSLLSAMRREHQGTLRCGTFFQSRLAPLGARLLPQKVLHRLIRRHYR